MQPLAVLIQSRRMLTKSTIVDSLSTHLISEQIVFLSRIEDVKAAKQTKIFIQKDGNQTISIEFHAEEAALLIEPKKYTLRLNIFNAAISHHK